MTSSFYKVTKLAWWKIWKDNTIIKDNFRRLSWSPFRIEDEAFKSLEKLVCIAYDVQNRFACHDVNKLRSMLFLNTSENNLRNLPPSRDGLIRHIQRQHMFLVGYGEQPLKWFCQFLRQLNGVGS